MTNIRPMMTVPSTAPTICVELSVQSGTVDVGEVVACMGNVVLNPIVLMVVDDVVDNVVVEDGVDMVVLVIA